MWYARKEAEELLALPYLLKENENEKYKSVRSVAHREDEVVGCWPEAMQYLLQKYAKSLSINKANMEFRDTRQRDEEEETSY